MFKKSTTKVLAPSAPSLFDRPNSGIYKITCTKNGYCYIGSSQDVPLRWRQHQNNLKRKAHHNTFLQRAWNKHGEAAFEFSLLENVPDTTLLLVREQHYFNTLSPKFNASMIAGKVEMTAEVCAKISAAKKLSNTSMKGKTQSPEAKAKIAAANIGKKHSDETKAKLSEFFTGKPGHLHTSEAKAKISAAHKGRIVSPEMKAHLSALNTGKKHSDETKAKISAVCSGKPSFWKGKQLSTEHRAKMSAAHKRRFAQSNDLS
jgi:GIY-YIG catalytic domain/NUMOD3 motif